MCNCVSSANWRSVDKMDLAKIEKKLREAGFFLNQMRDRESNAYGDKEPFDFYLCRSRTCVKNRHLVADLRGYLGGLGIARSPPRP